MSYNQLIKNWIVKIKEKELNTYLHFDKKIDLNKDILLNETTWKKYTTPQDFFEDFFLPKNIAERWFWPLIHFKIKEKKIKRNKIKNTYYYNHKSRDIYYASHYDSLVLSFYSFIIGNIYEEKLRSNVLNNEVIAYRSIQTEDGEWKNNIYFAKDAFEEILNIKNCYVYAFDISKFFDSLNREYLLWMIKEMGIELTPDWVNIINTITKFSYIEKTDIRKFKLVPKGESKISVESFKLAKKLYPIKYKESRNPKFVKKNSLDKWIAQGTAISWMLANLYMFDFDLKLKRYAELHNGKYYRYSDDILLILPIKDGYFGDNVLSYIQWELIPLSLSIKKEKTEFTVFKNWQIIESYSYKSEWFIKDQYLKPIQYLWFTFNWITIGVRNKTLSRHYIRMKESIKKVARLNDWENLKNWVIYLWDLKKRFTPTSKPRNKRGRYSNFYWYILQASIIMRPLLDRLSNKDSIKRQVIGYTTIFQDSLKKRCLKK